MSGAEDPADAEISWRRRGRPAPDDPFAPRSGGRKRSPEPGAFALSVADRVRIARTAGRPQAVVRIMAYRRGRDATWRTMTYVAKKSGHAFVVEGDVEVEGRNALACTLDDWSRDFTTRANGRDVVHLEVSAPPGSDRTSVFAAARAFAGTTFGENHQYLLAEHRDTAHPHAHLIVKLKRHDGRALDPRKRDLAAWRSAFAAAARDEGVALEASPRAARGVVRRSPSQALVQLRRRGHTPDTDRARLWQAIAMARGGRAAPSEPERRARARIDAERAAFLEVAHRLAAAVAEAAGPAERAILLRMARDVAAYVVDLPPPRTERDELIEKAKRIDALRAKAASVERGRGLAR